MVSNYGACIFKGLKNIALYYLDSVLVVWLVTDYNFGGRN